MSMTSCSPQQSAVLSRGETFVASLGTQEKYEVHASQYLAGAGDKYSVRKR